MSWLTEKQNRRVALIASLFGSLAGLLGPDLLENVAAPVEHLLKLFVLW